MPEVHDSFCRFCHASCPIKVTVEDGRPVSVMGAKDNPVYHGYTCAKGRALPEQHLNPSRLLRTVKRDEEGDHHEIPVEQAMDEIAAQLQQIVAEHGPRSVALYTGTYSFPYPAGTPMAAAWLQSLGSPMHFTSATIDQPGKMIAPALHGTWGGGPYHFDASDVWMLVGANPTISKSIGIPCMNPAKRLHDAVKRGIDLIVIDPRRSEAAKVAKVFLQPKAGEDPTLLAGMIRVILAEGLGDLDFVAKHTRGLDDLRAAVEPFTLDYVERRAGVPAEDVSRAARVFAAHRNGGANVGTGPNMAPRGNLSEYLTLALNTLAGHWRREGEALPNPGVLMAPSPSKAQAFDPYPAWGFGEQVRVRNLTNTVAGMPTAALEPVDRDTYYAFRLVSRRLPDVHNSAGRDIPKLVRKWSYNPAFMNPEDLAEHGLSTGDVIEITSSHSSILGVVEPEQAIRRGVISMPHAFGDAPGSRNDKNVREFGSNTGRLSSVDRNYDPYTGIPMMSAIPVNVARAEESVAS